MAGSSDESSGPVLVPQKKARLATDMQSSAQDSGSAPTQRGPYMKRFQPLLQDGPLVIVAVISHLEGRYSEFFAMPSHKVFQTFLQDLFEDPVCMDSCKPDPGEGLLLGFLVVSSWRLVQALTSISLDLSTDVADKKTILMHTLAASGVKGLRAMMECHVHAAAKLEKPKRVQNVNLAEPFHSDTLIGLNRVLNESLQERVLLHDLSGHPVPGAPAFLVPQLWDEWKRQFSLSPEHLGPNQIHHYWALCPLIGLGLVQGLLPMECGAISSKVSTFLLEPAARHEKLLKSLLQTNHVFDQPLLKQGHGPSQATTSASADAFPKVPLHDTTPHARQLGSMTGYSCRHLVLAIHATQHVSALGRLEVALDSLLKFGCATNSPYQIQELKDTQFKVPSRFTLARSRVRLDITCALVQRYVNHLPRPRFRQLNFDASPQGGLEVLGCKEISIDQRDVTKVCVRYLPLQSLGHGHAGLLDRAACVLNAIFLEAGPDKESIDKYLQSVSVCLTDRGPESDVVDLPNLTGAMLADKTLDIQTADAGHLFPNAIKVLDVNHLTDWILRDSVSTLPWFKDTEKQTKALTAFLNKQVYVDKLRARMRSANATSSEHQRLKGFSATFAKWRFGTLYNVCKNLLDVEFVLKTYYHSQDFNLRDGAEARLVQDTIADTRFWGRLRVLHHLSLQAQRVQGWACACACHEQECLDAARKGTIFDCPQGMKGRRATELHGRLQGLLQEWGTSMENLLPTLLGTATPPDHAETSQILFAMRRFQAATQLKFGFTNEFPWTLWRVRNEPAIADQLVKDFDAAEASGKWTHRLLKRFCSPLSDLPNRQSLLEHAAGQPISAILHEALLPYENALLDGKGAEGVHRDVHQAVRHAPSSRFPYWAAAVRLSQNLETYGILESTNNLDSFEDHWLHYKSIVQKPKRASDGSVRRAKTRNARLPEPDFLAKVYRLFPHNLENLDWLKPTLQAGKPNLEKAVLSDLAAVKLDFVKGAFRPGDIVTAPRRGTVSLGRHASDFTA